METRPQYQRCVSFCTARYYDLNALAFSFKRKDFATRLSKDVLHVSGIKKIYDLFFFNYGSFVCWGLTKGQEQKWLEYIKPFEKERLEILESDRFSFRYGEEVSLDAHERFKVDVITLDSYNPQIKLAISYCLAQSVKLEAFEDAIQVTIRKNGVLPEEIASKGMVTLSRRMIFKRMGDIFIARSFINLNSEYLDTPEFFWRNPNLETFYIMTKKFLDIPSRVMALNQKLDVLQELLDILNSQLQHRHSTLLESIIIILILIEIAISILHFHLN